MSTLTPDQLKEIALTVDLGERLTLIIVFGPGYLANDGLAEIQEVVGVGRRVMHHRLDRLGPDIAETVAGAGDSRPVVLVSGLERMAAERHEQVQASMNLLRDTLSKRPAAVVMWIPVEIDDEFRRLCVDLFQWRTLTVYVEGPEGDERHVLHEYLVALAFAQLTPATLLGRTPIPELPVTNVGELQVRVEGDAEPRGIDTWLSGVQRGLLLGPAGSGKTTALRRYAARRADELLDGEDTELPVVVAARQLDSRRIDWHALSRAAVPSLGNEAASWLAQQLASVPAILLIDGLDELSWARLGFDARFLALLAHNPRLRVVLAARHAYVAVGEWQEAEVLPLERDAASEWLRHVGYDPAAFMAALASGGAEELTMTPLSLQLVTALAGPRGDLLQVNLTDLIGEIVSSRLGRWDQRRGVTVRSAYSSSAARLELVNLAGSLMRDQSESERSRRSQMLDLVAERSGLIRRDEEEGIAHYEFTNRMFRDYFAGCWLAAQEPSPARLAGHAADPTWRLPTLHTLNLLGSRELEQAADKIWEASADQPPPARWSMRALVLRTTLARSDPSLQSRFIGLAKVALEQAQRDAELPTLWAPVAELLERVGGSAQR